MSILNAILFAVAAFAASAVVLGAAWGLGRGRPAATRHLIWSGAFAVLLALPLAAALLPSQLVWRLPAPAPVSGSMETVTATAAPVVPPAIDAADIVLAVAGLWAAGVLLHLLRLAAGGLGLVVLHRRSVPHIPHGIAEGPFRGLGWQLRLRTAPGAADSGPLTWGVLKPVVLLPKSSVTWPRQRLMSVLLHEAAHVRRKDCLARLVAVLACALYWPNPLVWLAARSMRADGESAADDFVLAAGVKPTLYAEHLVGLAREFAGGAYAMGLSMADRAALDGRVAAILDPKKSRTGVTKMDVLKIAALGIAATSALALARPSLADTPPAPDHAVPGQAVSRQTVQTQTDTIVYSYDDESKAPKHLRIRVEGVKPGTTVVHVADADMPPPPAPPAPVAGVPPVPPTPATAAVPPTPPAAMVPPPPPAPPAHVRTQVQVEISAADKAAMKRAASTEVRRAMAEARKAIADAHIGQVVADALKQAHAEMANSKTIEAETQKAIAAAHIDQVVAEAMKKAEIAIRNAEVKVVVKQKHLARDGDEETSDNDSED